MCACALYFSAIVGNYRVENLYVRDNRVGIYNTDMTTAVTHRGMGSARIMLLATELCIILYIVKTYVTR